MSKNIQIVLQVLPSSNSSSHDLIKTSESYVILSSIPKSLIFQFDQVLNANIDQELYNDYFYNHVPKKTLHELLKGNDTSIIIYNDSLNINTRDSFDMKLIEAFSNLFESNLKQLEIFISFFEYNQNDEYISQRDLISSGSLQPIEYEIHTIEQLKKYHLLGLNHHKQGQVSVFSILLKMDNQESKINIINLTNDADMLKQLSDYLYFSPKSVIEKSPLLHMLDQSQSLYFISSLDLSRPLPRLQQQLSFTSTIYQRLKKKMLPKSAGQDDVQYLRQVIARLSHEMRHHEDDLRSSMTSSSYHGSVFSAMSQATQLTTMVEEEKKLELWALNEKQAELIARYEGRLAEQAELIARFEEQQARLNEQAQVVQGMLASLYELGHEKDVLIGELERVGQVSRLLSQKRRQLARMEQVLDQHAVNQEHMMGWLHQIDGAVADKIVGLAMQVRDAYKETRNMIVSDIAQLSDGDDDDWVLHLESQLAIKTQDNKNLLDRITKLNNDLESERKNNLKLSRANYTLEKRIDDLITNKKNKFFCF